MISALLELQGKNEATQREEDTVNTLIDAEKVVEGAVMGCESRFQQHLRLCSLAVLLTPQLFSFPWISYYS